MEATATERGSRTVIDHSFILPSRAARRGAHVVHAEVLCRAVCAVVAARQRLYRRISIIARSKEDEDEEESLALSLFSSID